MERAHDTKHLRAVGVNFAVAAIILRRNVSIPTAVLVPASVSLSIVSVRSVGAWARAASVTRFASSTLELALAAASELGCVSLARCNGIFKFTDQVVILVKVLEVSQKVLGSIAKEADVLGLLAVAFHHAQIGILVLGLLVSLDEPLKVGRHGGLRAIRRVAGFFHLIVLGVHLFFIVGIGA